MIDLEEDFGKAENILKVKSAVLIFYSEDCGTCDQLFKNLEDYNTKDFYKFKITPFRMKFKFPEIYVFKNGHLVLTKKGILYNKQIKEIFQILDNE